MELNEYLDSLGLPAEDRTQLATILAKAGDKATAPLLMRSDYTRKTQELAAERSRIAGESAAVNKALEKALKDLESNKLTAAQYRTRLERIQDEYGVDVTDVLSQPAPAAASARTNEPVIDPAIMQRLETAEKNYGVSPLIAARLSDLRDEYVDLFGTAKGFSAEKLLDYAKENNIALRSDPTNGGRGAFQELYKVNDRRSQLQREQIEAEANKKAEERYQQRVSELSLGDRTGERKAFAQNGSAVLNDRFKNVVIKRTAAQGGEGEKAPEIHEQPRSAAENERSGGASRFEKAYMERRLNGVPLGAPAEKSKVA